MKTISLIVLLALSTSAAAQVKTMDVSAPDLIIIKSKLSRIDQTDVSRSNPPSIMDGPPGLRVNPPEYEWYGWAELEIQNTGNRTIKNIDWDFFLIEDGKSGLKSRGHRIRSARTIRPGETVKLVGRFKADYLAELNKRGEKETVPSRAEIRLIKYESGRTWISLKVKPKK